MEKEQNIIIVDYGMGNLRSVFNKFKKIGVPAKISSDLNEISSATKLILPGVGHFANGMRNLKQMGLLDLLNKKVIEEKTPILGICLGMQLFTKFSEEGNVEGLGWIDAQTVRFKFDPKVTKLKIPHMAWNSVQIEKESKLHENIPNETMFYFVHAYHVECNDKTDILDSAEYVYRFTSAVERGNIYGTQYHPEKSHDEGLQLLKNFIAI